MKILVATVLAAGSALCQQDNAAADAAKKRLESLKLTPPATRVTTIQPRAILMAGQGNCSIPLLNALPPNAQTASRMPTVRPSGKPLAGEVVDVPAPPCTEVAAVQIPEGFVKLNRRPVTVPVLPAPTPAPSPNR